MTESAPGVPGCVSPTASTWESPRSGVDVDPVALVGFVPRASHLPLRFHSASSSSTVSLNHHVLPTRTGRSTMPPRLLRLAALLLLCPHLQRPSRRPTGRRCSTCSPAAPASTGPPPSPSCQLERVHLQRRRRPRPRAAPPGARPLGPVQRRTLGHLTALQVLSLRANNLSGAFPDEFLALEGLTGLHLQANAFSGDVHGATVHHGFARLRSLQVLDLSFSFNGFNGSMPGELSNLAQLLALNLSNNSLSVRVPDLSLPAFQFLNLSNNHFDGPVPKSLPRFPDTAFAGKSMRQGPSLAFDLEDLLHASAEFLGKERLVRRTGRWLRTQSCRPACAKPFRQEESIGRSHLRVNSLKLEGVNVKYTTT
ncbi:hypothetical protein ACQ4PT_040814 [Festuca glaucescens]